MSFWGGGEESCTYANTKMNENRRTVTPFFSQFLSGRVFIYGWKLTSSDTRGMPLSDQQRTERSTGLRRPPVLNRTGCLANDRHANTRARRLWPQRCWDRAVPFDGWKPVALHSSAQLKWLPWESTDCTKSPELTLGSCDLLCYPTGTSSYVCQCHKITAFLLMHKV